MLSAGKRIPSRWNSSYVINEARGFTLLEVLLVLVIFSVSAALVAPIIGGGIDTTATMTTAKKLGAALNQARNLAVRERINYSVKIIDDNISVATGKGLIKKEFAIPKGVNISRSPAGAMIFYPRGGASGGSYIVKGHGEINVLVTSSGVVRIADKMKAL